MFNCEEDDEENDDDNSSVSSNEIENNHEELQIKPTEIFIPLDQRNTSNTNNIISGVSFVDDDPNDSVAGSDDPNEKNSNWSGSNDDSVHSSNHDSSLTGGTSRDEHSSKSSTQSNNNHEKYNNRNNGNLTKKQIDNNNNNKMNHQINDTQMLSFSFNHKRYDNVKNTNDCNMHDVSNDGNIDMKDRIQIYQPPYNTNPHALEITSSDMKKRKFHLDNNKQRNKISKNNFISKPSFNSNEVSNNNSSSNCHTNKEMQTNTNPNSSGSGTSSNECNWVTTDPKNGTKVSNNSSCSMSLDTEAVKAIALGCLPIDAVLRPRT